MCLILFPWLRVSKCGKWFTVEWIIRFSGVLKYHNICCKFRSVLNNLVIIDKTYVSTFPNSGLLCRPDDSALRLDRICHLIEIPSRLVASVRLGPADGHTSMPVLQFRSRVVKVLCGVVHFSDLLLQLFKE